MRRTGNFRSSSTRSMTSPTAPVAPATATTYPSLRMISRPSSSRVPGMVAPPAYFPAPPGCRATTLLMAFR